MDALEPSRVPNAAAAAADLPDKADARASGAATPTALDAQLCTLPTNDLGNAERLEQRNPDLMWWTTEWGVGVWDGKRFDFDGGESRAGVMAQETSRRLLAGEAPAFYRTQARPHERLDEFEKRAAQFHRWALRSGDNSRTEAMLKQAARRRTRPLADFNADPELLAVANGVLKLPRDGSAVSFTPKHDPTHLNTCVALAKYDPNAKAPEFQKFLDRVQPDPEMQALLARLCGYGLTGHIDEQAYFIFQGKGGDGKSTFLMAIEATLGGYVANADINTFLKRDKKGSDHSADVARLASGRRLVKAAEPEQGSRFAEAMLKSITGGEPVVARAPYKLFFEYIPAWKLIVSCNRKPQIRGDDRGIWRRTMLVPWSVSLPSEDMDKRLAEKLDAERDGILNWMLAGFEDWVEHGLAPPQAVLEATEDYRLQSNPFGVWFDACLELGQGKREPSSRLYKCYSGFVGELGFQPMTATAFGRSLSDRNLTSMHSNGMQWLGVRLNADGERALDAWQQRQDDEAYGSRR